MFYFQWNIIRIKFKIFLAMTSLFSGRRSPALVYLSPDCVYFYNSRCVFYISKLLKASHPKSHQHPAKSKAYARGYVFISHTPPPKPVSSITLSRWGLDILDKAGVHTKTFKTHSLHWEFTSNAISGGLFFKKIPKAAGWTNAQWWSFLCINCKDNWMYQCKNIWENL